MPGQQSTTVPKGRPADPSPASQPIDQRIVIVRQDLESVFTELETVLDVVVTVHKALLHQHADQDEHFGSVLQRCGSNKLHEQLLELTIIIQQLGGTTSYSDQIDVQVADILGGGREGGHDE